MNTPDLPPLLPCPFCRGAASFERMGTRRQSCIITCGNCGARHESGDEGANSGQSWNTRAYGDARAAAAVLAEQKKAERLRAKLQEIGDFAASCATGPGLREALAMIEQMVAAPGEQQP